MSASSVTAFQVVLCCSFPLFPLLSFKAPLDCLYIHYVKFLPKCQEKNDLFHKKYYYSRLTDGTKMSDDFSSFLTQARLT